MATRRLHYIDHDGLHSYLAVGGSLHLEQRFPSGDEGAQAFALWLQADHQSGLHTLLVELVDEGFHTESIPPVVGADRKALIQRKLAQHFFGSPYATSLSLGREHDGRRDERILFAAITRPQALEPWLNALRAQEAAVSAIYTVPLLTQQLLGGMHPDSSRGLILALSSAGIRQIYFEDSKLRFSRLSPRPETPFARWAPDCLREAQKTYQYLSAQRWLARGSKLPVWVMLHEKDRASVMGELVSTDNLEFHATDLRTLAQHFGMREQLTSSDCRPLLMRMALREQRAPQLASRIDRHFFRLWQTRTAILATGVLSFAICAFVAAKYYLDARNLRQEAAQTRIDAQFEASRYRQLIASLPAMPTSLDTLRDVVNGFERTAMKRTDPQLALEKLSHALDRFPDVEVKRIEWHQDNLQEGTGGNTSANPAKNDAGSSTNGTATNPIARRQSALLDAQLPEEASSDPRAAITRIGEFTEELRKQSGGEVSLVKQPFDVGSDKTLKSDTETIRKRPEFQLRLTLSGPAS